MNIYDKINLTLNCIFNGQLSFEIDDTLLQKLISKLESSYDFEDNHLNISSLIKGTRILSYLTDVLNQLNKDPMVISFSLQLLSVILQEEILDILHDDQSDLLNGLLIKIKECSLEKSVQASVRVSSLQCLTSILKTKHGFPWIIKNDLIDYGWKSMTERSIYVQRASETFLANCLLKIIDKKMVESKLFQNMYEVLSTELNFQSVVQRPFIGCVNLLSLAVPQMSPAEITLMGNSLKCLLIEALNAFPNDDECSEKLSKLVALMVDESAFHSIFYNLVKNGRLIAAIKFCSNYLNFQVKPDSIKAKTHLAILESPLLILASGAAEGSTRAELAIALESLLSHDKAAYRKLLVTSLGCLSKASLHMDEQFKAHILRISISLTGKFSKNETLESDQSLLTGCQKVLIPLLSFQKQVINDNIKLDSSTAEYFLKVHTTLLQDISLSSVAFQSISRLIGQMLCLLWTQSSHEGQEPDWLEEMDPLGECLCRRLVDRHWEMVDSIIELCTALFSFNQAFQERANWFLKHNLHTVLWNMLANHEAEGYVRAACIHAMVALVSDSLVLKSLQQDSHFKAEAFEEKLCHFLRHDQEAFVQRAAAQGLHHLLKNDFLTPESPLVMSTLFWAITCCLDWEVKVTAMLIWDDVLTHALNQVVLKPGLDSVITMFLTLFNNGCLTSLVCSLKDCDRPVKLMGAEVVLKMRNIVQGLECATLLSELLAQSKIELPVSEIRMEGLETLVDVDSAERDEVMDIVVDTDMHDRITAVIKPCSDKIENVFPDVKIGFVDWQSVVSFLWTCNLENVIKESSQSTDLYENNLCALLDDIMAAVDSEKKEEYQAIDCY